LRFLREQNFKVFTQKIFLKIIFIVFDPNVEIDISDQQYTQIHNEYKNLVDFMLGNFLQELSITPEEFEVFYDFSSLNFISNYFFNLTFSDSLYGGKEFIIACSR
jgi:hypothetical protein